MHSTSERKAHMQRYLAGVISETALRRRISTLPKELRDTIHDLVFTAEPGKRVIGPETKPPAQLQVSRATRAQYAHSYYGNDSRFFFPGNGIGLKWTDPDCYFIKWARCVDERHKSMVAMATIVLNNEGLGAHDTRFDRTCIRYGFGTDILEARVWQHPFRVLFADELQEYEEQKD